MAFKGIDRKASPKHIFLCMIPFVYLVSLGIPFSYILSCKIDIQGFSWSGRALAGYRIELVVPTPERGKKKPPIMLIHRTKHDESFLVTHASPLPLSDPRMYYCHTHLGAPHQKPSSPTCKLSDAKRE
jgi:hypothetical protein